MPDGRAPTRAPNIMLIMSDQHRSDVMGCAGDPVVRTPHMDRLAAEGVRYSHVYCQGPLCMPARASFLTERYVRDHGVARNDVDVPATLPTFVQAVAGAGYHTSCIGKMHLWVHGAPDIRDTRQKAPQLQRYGFAEPIETAGKRATVKLTSEYTDYLADRGRYDTYRQWVAQRRYRLGGLPIWATDPNPVTGDDYIDTWHGRRVVQWIEEYDRSEPFFQWVGFPGPHDPWDAPAEYVDLYAGASMPAPGSVNRPDLGPDGAFHDFLAYFLNTHSDSAHLTDEVIAEIRRHYYANVTVIDDAIGAILGALDRRGMLDNTWLIYTSDHGEMLGEHGMLTKMVFYEPSVRVPLIIRPPGGCQSQVVHDLVEHFDVSATIRSIAGAAAEPGFEGRPLFAEQPQRHRVLSENFGFGLVRSDCYALVFQEATGTPVQLFDLVEDPFEDHNVAADPANAGVVEALMGEVA